MIYLGVILLATVLWGFAMYMNGRREPPPTPIKPSDYETDDPSDASPTIPLRAAAAWLATGSHWGHDLNLDPADARVAEQLVERLAAGELAAWGRRTQASPLVRLRPTAFATGLIDLPEDTLFIVDNEASYFDLRLNEDEVKRAWPAAAP